MTGVKVRVIIEKGTDFWRMMDPGYVSFCRRSKELSAVFQGILEAPLADGCWVDVLNPDTGEFVDGYWDKLCLLDNCLVIKDDRTVFAEGCLTEKEVSLMLATMNVNAFNFIIADLGPGEHTITVKAMVDSLTDWGAGSAEARATIGKGSVAGEEVKMIKEEDVNGEAVP